MREFEIRLRSVQEVQDFVDLATTKPFTVLVCDDYHRVNGKSFMEMFCLNAFILSQDQTLMFKSLCFPFKITLGYFSVFSLFVEFRSNEQSFQTFTH